MSLGKRSSEKSLHRRTFLRGVGTAIALPWLESLSGSAAWGGRSVVQQPPTRLAFLFVPNGIHMPNWTPQSEGSDFELPPTLQPLAGIRNELLVLSGLAHDKACANGDGAGDHARSGATFLTGSQAVKTHGEGIRVGISVDQVAAKHLGGQTRFASLELGCESGRQAGSCDNGYSCAYSNNISWRSASTPAGKEINPRLVFDRLLGIGNASDRARSRARRDQDRKSVLDLVGDDARRLHARVSSADRHKLDEYLESVRDVERRIDAPGDRSENLFVEGQLTRPRGIPADYAKHVRLMGDLMVLAFQTNLTQVCSLMFANAGSGKTYPTVGAKEGHHFISHHKDEIGQIEKIAKINHYHIQQLAYILEKLKATPEGEGTLLDHSLIVYGSAISDGNRHLHHDLPILLAGRGGGAIAPGRHVRYAQNTPLMNLFLSMLHTAGIPADTLGDSTGELPGLNG